LSHIFYVSPYTINIVGSLQRLGLDALSVLNAGSVIGRIIPGILADKIGRYNTFIPAGFAAGFWCLLPSFMAPDQVDHSDILLRCIVWIFLGCICIFGSGCLGSDFEDGKAGYTDWVVLWYPALCVSFTPTTQRQTWPLIVMIVGHWWVARSEERCSAGMTATTSVLSSFQESPC
jgi:MFS family permease